MITPTHQTTTSAGTRWVRVGIAAALIVMIGTAVWWVGGASPSDDPAPTSPVLHGAVAQTAEPVAMTTVPGTTLKPARTPLCAQQTDEAFVPSRIVIPGVTGGAAVLALPRDGHNVPGVPPLSGAGKEQIAWDRPPGLLPGSPAGNVLLNAHTWPDGSALGNRMLNGLTEGDRIVVQGDDKTLCYRVTKRVEVLASQGYPPYYDTAGPPQLALLVCSGQRRGPGDWTHRTIWFASPMNL